MGKLLWLVVGTGVGMAWRYFWDEQHGQERRSRMLEQAEMATRDMKPHLEQVRRMKDQWAEQFTRRGSDTSSDREMAPTATP